MDKPLCPSSGVFKREHCNAFLLRRILSQEGCNIMKDIFELNAVQKDDNETIKEYLLRVNKISESDYCNKLGQNSRKKIEHGPSDFDITLWFKVLQMTGGKIANYDHDNWLTEGTLEHCLKKIKDFRNNDLCHTNFYFPDTDCKQKILLIRGFLVNAWQLVKEKYGIDDATVKQKIRDLNRNIDTLEKEPINDLTLEEGEYLDLVKKHQGIVQDEGKKECKKTVDMMSYIVLDSKTRLRANDIFVEPGLKLLSSNESIKTTGLLAYAHQMKKRKDGLAQVILVEGNAGVGKTTFLQLLFSEWSSGNIYIKELDHYEFIIAISLNRGDSSLSSLGGIIRSQLPETFKKFHDEKQLQDHLLSLKTLITVDGLEELDPQSLKLFEEILDKASENTCITIVCTTRPEKVEQYYKMVRDDMVTIHFKLNGVPESSMEDLLYLYHCTLVKQQKSEDLLLYFKRILPLIKDEWKLPLSLLQMSYMCGTDPECVNSITTTCELSNRLHELMKKNLVKRLSKHESPEHLEEGRLQKSVSKFMFRLCQEALYGFQHGNLTLNENATKNLKNCCDNLELLPEEVLNAFLVAKNVRLNLAGSLENKIESKCWEEIVEAQDGDLTLRKSSVENCLKNHYPSLDLPEEERTDDSQRDFTSLEWAFDNKRQQEFFAGLYIRDLVTGESESLAIESIKKDMMKCLNKHQVPFHNQERIFDRTCEKLGNLYEKSILPVLGNLIAPEKFFESLDYRRILIMLIGLFYMAGNKISVGLVKKVVQLMKRSGELDRDSWIGIFNSIYFDEVTSKLIDQKPGILEGTDNLAECNVANIYAYATWFREFCPERENMNPLMNLFEEPHFDELLVSVIRHHCIVKEDHLNYLFQHPELPLSKTHFDVSIDKLLTESKRREYTGPLTPQMKIPETVRKLRASVADAQSYAPLKHFLESNSNLAVLEVCVNVQIDPSCLSPLEFKHKRSPPSLFIPDVTDQTFQKAVNIISSMQPNCILNVYFPRCKMGKPRKAKLESYFKKMRKGCTIMVNFPPFCEENQGTSFFKTDDHTHMEDSNEWKNWKDWL